MKADNRYVPFLDGFRGYAILLVIIGHLYRDLIKVALLGVTLFFFVSGFLITKLLIAEHRKRHTILLKEFYLRRVFRLYPALLFFLLITIAFILLSGQSILVPDIMSGLFYFTNYYLVYFKPVLQSVTYPLVSEILWSLSVEEHFYLFFPVLFLMFFSDGNNKLLYVLGMLLILFLFSRVITFFQGADLSEVRKIIYYTTHNRGDSILFGCVSALLIYRYNAKFYIKYLSSGWLFISALVLLGLIEIVPSQLFQNTFKYSFQGIAFSIIVPSFLFGNSGNGIRKCLEGKVIVFVGKLSYSLYLFHWLAIKIITFYVPQKGLIANLFIVVLSLILALLSYYSVERPFLSLRRKFGSHAK
ncbi:acyltransferase [Agriterribacter sp.]|uniref:acyltransferase family protein n=1 Tax=Agriterribacter sp. TaxID=2821509 RepID=UPI002C88882D|nr:acyltransferase [Agriterribacter sp.]HRP54469.1 acyltransferase [Agriterribacter sp.]